MSSAPSGHSGGLLFSPYKDISAGLDLKTYVVHTAATGASIPIVGHGSVVSDYEPSLGAITLGFAQGECGRETWGSGMPAAAFASANIPALDGAGLDYVVSTGGAGGLFTCSTQSGMRTFLSRYASTHLVGVDYDIENGQSQGDVDNLVAQSVYAQALQPNLRFSFTLATLAASNGSYASINPLGDMVVKAIQASTLKNYTINLMVMNLGGASPDRCVVVNGRCDMGISAIQAAQNLEHKYGIPPGQIELTPMIGADDASGDMMSLADVDTMTSWALSNGLAGLHIWALDRDSACASSTSANSCNANASPLQYTSRFLYDLAR